MVAIQHITTTDNKEHYRSEALRPRDQPGPSPQGWGGRVPNLSSDVLECHISVPHPQHMYFTHVVIQGERHNAVENIVVLATFRNLTMVVKEAAYRRVMTTQSYQVKLLGGRDL